MIVRVTLVIDFEPDGDSVSPDFITLCAEQGREYCRVLLNHGPDEGLRAPAYLNVGSIVVRDE